MVLRGARLEDAAEIDGMLEVRLGESVLRLSAERVETEASEGTIRLDFPTLVGLAPPEELRRVDALQLVLEWAGDLEPFAAVYVAPPGVRAGPPAAMPPAAGSSPATSPAPN